MKVPDLPPGAPPVAFFLGFTPPSSPTEPSGCFAGVIAQTIPATMAAKPTAPSQMFEIMAAKMINAKPTTPAATPTTIRPRPSAPDFVFSIRDANRGSSA